MFNCAKCRHTSKPREKSYTIALGFRDKTYRPRQNCQHRRWDGLSIKVDDPGGVGKELIGVATVCGDCAIGETVI